jgi:hypothetical protein
LVDDEILPRVRDTQFLQLRFRGFYIEESSPPIHFPIAFDMKEVERVNHLNHPVPSPCKLKGEYRNGHVSYDKSDPY